MNTNIYVLKLKDGFYYVGKSENVEKRFEQHVQGVGASFTKIHEPLSIDKTIMNVSVFEEDKVVKEYMAIHGINKVRGGTYVNETLDEEQIRNLKKEIWGAKDLCTRCGRNTHWIKYCRETIDIEGVAIINNIKKDDIKDIPNKVNKPAPSAPLKRNNGLFGSLLDYGSNFLNYVWGETSSNHVTTNNVTKYEKKLKNDEDCCYRCGREGHYAKKCYAKTDIEGNDIEETNEDYIFVCDKCNKEFDDEKECLKHEKICKSKNKCYRCGRNTHYANTCNAKTDINGDALSSDSD